MVRTVRTVFKAGGSTVAKESKVFSIRFPLPLARKPSEPSEPSEPFNHSTPIVLMQIHLVRLRAVSLVFVTSMPAALSCSIFADFFSQ